jgi:hypothetical protein
MWPFAVMTRCVLLTWWCSTSVTSTAICSYRNTIETPSCCFAANINRHLQPQEHRRNTMWPFAAMTQVRAADVAVLNKCDLATLASMAAVEDALQQLLPGVRMLRARFGQVGVVAALQPCIMPENLHLPLCSSQMPQHSTLPSSAHCMQDAE